VPREIGGNTMRRLKADKLKSNRSHFNPIEFEGFKNEAGLNRFMLSIKNLRGRAHAFNNPDFIYGGFAIIAKHENK
jgi:hypothetical protein